MALTLACLLVPVAVLSGQDGAVVTGRVVDEEGVPLPGTPVLVHQVDRIGALAGEDGRFVLRGVPIGRQVILALAVGYPLDVVFMNLADGDSVEVSLTLPCCTGRIPGSDEPEPTLDQGLEATALLRQVLRDAETVSRMGEFWPDLTESDTVPALVSWDGDGNPFALVGSPVLNVTHDCPACVTAQRWTIEAGELYTAGQRHLRVGLRRSRAGWPRVDFCLTLAEVGDQMMMHCGLGGVSFDITYFRRGPDDWVRVDPY